MKIDCLLCLGEVCLNSPQAAIRYLPPIIEVIMLCCNAAVGLPDSDFSYAEQLKDSIIECLMCIVYGLNFEGSQISHHLNQHVPEFFRFIMVTLDKKYQPTADYFNRTILLMGDMAKYYQMVVAPFKKDPILLATIATFKNFNKDGKYTKSINYAEQQFK